MDLRQADLESKLASLLKRVAGAKSPKSIFDAAEALALALEFRDTDAMIGLPAVPEALIDRARVAVIRARELAVEAGVSDACLQAAESIWLAQDRRNAKRAAELARRAESEPRAQYLLGLFAFNGFGQKKDLKQSLRGRGASTRRRPVHLLVRPRGAGRARSRRGHPRRDVRARLRGPSVRG